MANTQPSKQRIHFFKHWTLPLLCRAIRVFSILTVLPTTLFCQQAYKIETADIDNFWRACDQLHTAATEADSIQIIQTEYIDKATPYFKEFLRIRKFTAPEYVKLLKRYPKYWQSIRPLTENIANRKPEIEQVFEKFRNGLPGFKQPNVCFAIGCLRTGGTVSKNLILIGSEIAAADATVQTSELSPWLQSIMGNTGDIVAMIAHETVHTQQFNRRKYSLLTGCISEGSADFIAENLTGLNINPIIHDYGNKHECTLWKMFEKDMADTPRDMSRWLYQGKGSEGRPADLGYFIGYKIAEAYFAKQSNKGKALKTLLNCKKYPTVYKKSNYSQEPCSPKAKTGSD
ncbi:MAG: hypothetical protein KDD14_11490 [Saprospiraceae bacterium]|nr:hypothetical protein [Saprospiraceae bacterium]